MKSFKFDLVYKSQYPRSLSLFSDFSNPITIKEIIIPIATKTSITYPFLN